MATAEERVPRRVDPSSGSPERISAAAAENVAVIVPPRELDLLSCPVLHRRLFDQLDGLTCRVLVIDFTRVEFLGAAGLGVLVEVRDRARRCGIGLRLVVSSRPVWRPLLLTGLAGEFAIFADLTQALAGVATGHPG